MKKKNYQNKKIIPINMSMNKNITKKMVRLTIFYILFILKKRIRIGTICALLTNFNSFISLFKIN